jgi:hypothetical protein
MSDQLLHDDIVSFFRSGHQGRANAVPRKKLIAYLRGQGHSLPVSEEGADRKVRRIYAKIPTIGYTCEGEKRGLFWITSRDEARGVEAQQHSKSMSMLHREKEIREAAPTGQLGLWGGDHV